VRTAISFPAGSVSLLVSARKVFKVVRVAESDMLVAAMEDGVNSMLAYR
jgi:hypothetical protein